MVSMGYGKKGKDARGGWFFSVPFWGSCEPGTVTWIGAVPAGSGKVISNRATGLKIR